MNNKTQSPLFVIGASVEGDISIPNFFSEENNRIFELMKNPPYLRYSGWNLLTLDYPKIKNGEWWEVKNGDRKTIRLYEDGTFITSVYADNSFLGWGKSDEDFFETPSINSLALIEFIYEFVNVYSEYLKMASFKSGTITFQIKLINTVLSNGKKLRISKSSVNALFPELSEEIEQDKTGEIIVNRDEIPFDPRYPAYKLIAKMYTWFGVPVDKIPYMSTDEIGRGFINIESFPA